MRPSENTAFVVERARSLGFDLCGVAPAEDFPELGRLPEWLALGYAGQMHYLEDPRRRSPAAVVEGARSVIVCALNYNTNQQHSTEFAAQAEPGFGWISRYAWGEDYHRVLKKKLQALIGEMRARFDESFEARSYVDTGPVIERVAAKHAGLGWLGKNTCLIHEQLGSWLFLGVILTTLELAPSLEPAEMPPADLCGNCTLCLDACPTGALTEPYLMDARLCISYLTIELRGPVPDNLREPIGRHVFGCDICQDVCPWNRRAPATADPAFEPRNFAPPLDKLAAIDEREFRAMFGHTPVTRARYSGFLRNVAVAMGNRGLEEFRAPLERMAASGDAMVVEHARWALGGLLGRIAPGHEAEDPTAASIL